MQSTGIISFLPMGHLHSIGIWYLAIFIFKPLINICKVMVLTPVAWLWLILRLRSTKSPTETLSSYIKIVIFVKLYFCLNHLFVSFKIITSIIYLKIRICICLWLYINVVLGWYSDLLGSGVYCYDLIFDVNCSSNKRYK